MAAPKSIDDVISGLKKYAGEMREMDIEKDVQDDSAIKALRSLASDAVDLLKDKKHEQLRKKNPNLKAEYGAEMNRELKRCADLCLKCAQLYKASPSYSTKP